MLHLLEKYVKTLSSSRDGFLLLEQSSLNSHRLYWQEGRRRIQCLRRSKRFVSHVYVLGKALEWMTVHGTADSVVAKDEEEFFRFVQFPESF